LTGVITKALAGFYYVSDGGKSVECRARGRFRLDGESPLVGDSAEYKETEGGRGVILRILKRKNSFVRPSVANLDILVILASETNPVTDPYLIDRVAAIAQTADCGVCVCINKTDLTSSERLSEIYKKTPYTLISTSAVTLEGTEELRRVITGKTCAFTGNSGVGKSSLLNALSPGLGAKVGEVSEKLGRGRHTTRHIELFDLGGGTFIADTPGFASFDIDMMEGLSGENLQYAFPEFEPYSQKCRFRDCAHIKEPGCAVLDAVKNGVIHESRHNSYVKLREIIANRNEYAGR
jgi:ribosome biogenesis GTPase